MCNILKIQYKLFLILLLISCSAPVFAFEAFIDSSSTNNQTAATTGSDVCASTPKTISDLSDSLAYVSYSTSSGFDECVSRCITSVLIQVCPQLPPDAHDTVTQPDFKKQVTQDCIDNINHFVHDHIRCPYLKCEP